MISKASQYVFNNLVYGENGHEKNKGRYFEGIPFEQRVALTSLAMPDATRVWGMDGSHWNLPPLALQRMKDLYGMSFAIFKGCDGSLNTRYYPEHVAAAKQAGLPWGMYVWLYPNNKVSIDAQVNAWHARFMADPPPMGCFIDAEWTNYGGAPANPNATDLRTAHDKWRAKSGQKAITYTAKGYADTYLKGFDWSREELWVANYGVSSPNLPAGASAYTFWQFSSTLDGKQLDPNGNAELDGNYFNGSAEEFAARYGGSSTPPPNGGGMVNGQAREKLGKTSTVRTSPGVVAGNDSGQRIDPFATIEYVELVQGLNSTGDRWFKLPSGLYVQYIYAGRQYYDITREPSTDPDPEPPPAGVQDMPFTITLGGGESPYVETTVTGVVKAKK